MSRYKPTHAIIRKYDVEKEEFYDERVPIGDNDDLFYGEPENPLDKVIRIMEETDGRHCSKAT